MDSANTLPVVAQIDRRRGATEQISAAAVAIATVLLVAVLLAAPALSFVLST